jgi:predicted Fe-S protein YdhL (DUF1289 family)
MKKFNSSTGCYKIDIFADGVYICSTDMQKTCKGAIQRWKEINVPTTMKITAHFFNY